MKIINLKASNVKKLIAVDITPNGDVVKITGKNGAGKTSNNIVSIVYPPIIDDTDDKDGTFLDIKRKEL